MMLGHISQKLNEIGIHYDYIEWNSPTIVFPFWVGEYQETHHSNETNKTDYIFTLTGTSNKTWLDLENDKEKIKNLFTDYRYVENGKALYIDFNGCYPIPSEDASIKRFQITLNVMEWR